MSSLATPIAHTLRRIEVLPPRSIVVDRRGDVWQHGSVGDTGYWYRAYDGEGRSAWEAAQAMGPGVIILREGKVS